MPRVAPDGRHVAHKSTKAGSEDVYVRQLPSGGEEVRVSAAGGTDPVWAPDGRELFHRTADSLVVARVSPGPPFRVLDRRLLFGLGPLVTSAARSMYDVMPDGREFVMVGLPEAGAATRRLVVRLNWAPARLPDGARHDR